MATAEETHQYRARCSWRGSTGAGYRAYTRFHRGQCPPAPAVLALSADPAYRGNTAELNPEQLVVLAAASCQLLAFLAEAARAGIDVVAYDDEAGGEMPEGEDPQRITAIGLRPRITVVAPVEEAKVRELVDRAPPLLHRQLAASGNQHRACHPGRPARRGRAATGVRFRRHRSGGAPPRPRGRGLSRRPRVNS